MATLSGWQERLEETALAPVRRTSSRFWALVAAEFITVVALICGAAFVIIDLGRPDRVLFVFIYGRWQSPIIWDVLAITTYLTASIVYLFVPMIPDLALFRDRLKGRTSRWRAWLYRTLAIGWNGNAGQRRSLAAAIGVLMILIMPIAVSVHTVVSWIFAMTLRVPWNSALFGAFFVAGAIFSGIAILIVVMAILRRAYKLEEGAGFHLRQLFLNDFAPLFWFYLIGGLFGPIAIVLFPATRNTRGVVAAAILVTVAMWIEC